VFDHLEKSLTGFVVPPGVFAGQHGDTITWNRERLLCRSDGFL
jgi:hypothetical protein